MPKPLNFTVLDEDNKSTNPSRRWPTREPNKTVQMSVRMSEDTYEKFRQMCLIERRTNGDMLAELMKSYSAKEPDRVGG